jgi:hypothetical protein
VALCGVEPLVTGHTWYVYCVAQLDDGRVVSGSDVNTLKVWE